MRSLFSLFSAKPKKLKKPKTWKKKIREAQLSFGVSILHGVLPHTKEVPMPAYVKTVYSAATDHAGLDQHNETAVGDHKGVVSDRKFGFNNVGTSAVVISDGGLLWRPTTAITIRVKIGGNAADTAAGTGAQTIRVYGVNSDWEEIFEDIILAGASVSSATTEAFLRVTRAKVLTAGSGEVNVAAIDIETSDGVTDIALIAAGLGQTEIGHIAVPAGRVLLIEAATIFADTSKTADVNIWVGDPANSVKRSIGRIIGISGEVVLKAFAPDIFEEKMDLWVEGVVSSGTDGISVWIDYLLVEVG